MSDNGIGLLVAFVSIHMSVFVLLPLSKMISREHSKKTFWILFGIRAAYLLFFDFFITTRIAIFDFMSVFVAVPVILIMGLVRRSNEVSAVSQTVTAEPVTGATASPAADSVADSMANPMADSTAQTSQEEQPVVKNAVNPNNFDPIFSLSEKECVEQFIQKEMLRAGIVDGKELIPEEMLRRKVILNVIFSILLFVYLSMFFFHFPFKTYLMGLVILAVYAFCTSRYKLAKYIKKEVLSRPQEKVSNIVMNVKASLVKDYSRPLKLGLSVVAVVCALLLFRNPRIFYEKCDGGYAVRFYTYGITNVTSAVIPDYYKGKEVVGLRGNTFSNMFFLKEVSLPETITEIRGQAFKNCESLEEIQLPESLEYLGGGAFYNCVSLVSVNLPDSLSYLGGEAFYGCSTLAEVKLPSGLGEIRGNTFEECSNLQKIVIPDTVVRIGGHAFYGDSGLEEVIFSPDSSLQEIGSSAFRCCDSLREITLPYNVYINERAFKETPVRIQYYE